MTKVCHAVRFTVLPAAGRRLKRHHVAGRPPRLRKYRGQTFATVTQPGFIHLDVKYLTVLKGRRSLSLSKGEARYDLKQDTARGFIERRLKDCPLRVRVILTNRGMAWTDRCNHRVKHKPTDRHPGDQLCHTRQSQHRLTRPRSAQTHGRVERFHRGLVEGNVLFDQAGDKKVTVIISVPHADRRAVIALGAGRLQQGRLQLLFQKLIGRALHN